MILINRVAECIMIFVMVVILLFDIKLSLKISFPILLYYAGIITIFYYAIKDGVVEKIHIKQIFSDNLLYSILFLTSISLYRFKMIVIPFTILIFVMGVVNDVNNSYFSML